MPTSSESHICHYSPAANWFVEDAKPYGFAVNLCFFKRENTVLPYGIADNFCCFHGTLRTAFPTGDLPMVSGAFRLKAVSTTHSPLIYALPIYFMIFER